MAKANEKTKALEDKVKLAGKLVWDRYDEAHVKAAYAFAEGYKAFMNEAKTEREAVEQIVASAKQAGFRPQDTAQGKRIYRVNKVKSIGLAQMGTRPPAEGLRIIVSHIDSPRLDLKQNPLYEELDMVMLRTHYYGGIKKYQWVAQPLALHGVIVTAGGKTVAVKIGECDDDPVFTICDLLPHLSRRAQEEKKLKEAIEAEKMTS
jgi:aspartyl aminopeptidase